MKKLTTAKIWQFAAGQFGWAMLSGIISNWLVYFYQPDQASISQGQTVFIPQGLVVLGIFTIIGGITAFGRIFDAFTDPMIASWSDRCTSKNGRRIPFLKWASLPLALSTVLVFWSPVNKNSWINAAFLLVMILAYYLSITAYCTPYNALIPELGHTQQERLNISTVIFVYFYCRNCGGISGTDNLGSLYSDIWKSWSYPYYIYSDGSGGFYLYACSGLLYQRKGLCKYGSGERICFSFSCFHIQKRRVSQICRIGYFLLDRTYYVSDRPAFFCYQPSETSGNHDNTIFCRDDGIITGILCSGE